MHWCPDCGNPCFCDCEDTDNGEYLCGNCIECEHKEFYDDDLERELEDEYWKEESKKIEP